MISSAMARLSLADMGLFSDCARYACSSSSVRPFAASLRSLSPKRLSSTSSEARASSGVHSGTLPLTRVAAVLGVRGSIWMLSSDVDCALGLLGMPSWAERVSSLGGLGDFRRRRAWSLEELVDMPRPLERVAVSRRAQLEREIGLCNAAGLPFRE